MTHASFSHWYERGPFSAFVQERRLTGTGKVSLLHAVQTAGDLSDPPTSDVVLAVAHRSAFTVQSDYGFGRARTTVHHGACFLRPAGAAAAVLAEQANALRFFAFDDGMVRALAMDDGGTERIVFGGLHAAPFRCDFIVQLCERVWEAAGRQDAFERLYGDQATLLLINELRREARLRLTPARARGGLTRQQLNLACGAMMARMERGLPEPGLSELAALVGLSPNHFCKAFRESTGQPPHRWLSRRRIDRAQTLLLSTDWSLTEISLALGYGSHTAFTAAFRRETGLTPKALRSSR